MTDDEIFEHNARVRDQMHSAASAVLGAMIRNLHAETTTRILLTDPPLDDHAANYRILQGDFAYVEAYGDIYGLKTVTEELLEVHRE